MAKKFLVNIDLNQNEIRNVILQPLATAPSNPKEGQFYYNSADKKMYQWNGSKWNTNGVIYTIELGTVDATGAEIKLKGDDGSFSSAIIPLVTSSAAGLMSPAQFSKLEGIEEGANKTTVDTGMSNTSLNPIANKVIKTYVDKSINEAINALPADQFLDMNNTEFVESFAWSSTTYPNSTNPNLDGKPVLVLALTDGTTTAYSFVSLNDLVDVYTGTAPISVSGGTITHNDSGATAGSYGSEGNVLIGVSSPDYGNAVKHDFDVPYIKVDAKGHVTEISTKKISIDSDFLLTNSERLKLNGTPMIAGVRFTIPANSTTYTHEFGASLCLGVYSFVAIDAVTFEPVVIDWSLNESEALSGFYTSIVCSLSSYANDIIVDIIHRSYYD